ncbi:electron transfer flavoprotein subunit alpha/FixB family protein [Coxiella burnetii]|uniref:Electron transfer flavoprotein subunit alpha n=2 Tax=Coxiella burnetii TaxID=777 RepID=Q83CJ8_COXBU|nr:FAD-binding protein [Coxiella burnetii]NP_820116.1 electron transfer flavoprotein subunit alpha [Coxiella burnetii RSA 493]AAO90630.1 electron transfer flavoprotein alpha-subunit [Coxiella burnetii RSA 493]ABS77527.1 electron transfer flavoprotein alpha-subunit [Coxiella burnetii Dugway 5J108-111]ACJ20196.1 electron transfer flavoprotein alpha-subunit [Coxiella burnetii CbuK_Q154]AML49387.1 electron transfer flavoprotein subunit beta [Coxiella burnetii]AML55310.1 electron transfer flavopro
MSVLVLAEHDNQEVRLSTLCTITAARELKQPISILVAGYHCRAVAEKLTSLEGIDAILLADDKAYEHFLAESIAPLVLHCFSEFNYVMAPATTFGKNILPRVAAKLGASQISDVIKIVDEKTYCRPIYAGNAIATVQSEDKKQIITVRSTAFNPAALADYSAPIREIEFTVENPHSIFVHEERQGQDRPELSSAEIVISGGRGLQNKENFDRLIRIADRMGAAMGASRAAVDAGLAPNDCQVGQTGQVVAPKLYFAIGISGAVQHMAGMRNSKIIVAINKDPEAPIFQIADYGLVGDLNEVLVQWEEALQEMGY